MSDDSPNKRIQYPEEMLANAREAGCGLITMAVTYPSVEGEEAHPDGMGPRVTLQSPADRALCKHVHEAIRALFRMAQIEECARQAQASGRPADKGTEEA